MKNSEFKKALAKVNKLTKNVVNPVLLIKDCKITIQTSEVVYTFEAPVRTNTVSHIDFDTLYGFIKKIPASKYIQFEIMDGYLVVAVDGLKKYSMKLCFVDYQELELTEGYIITTLQSNDLIELRKYTSADGLRQAICGVYFDEEYLVATDAHKIKRIKHTRYNKDTFIIPNIVLDIINKDSHLDIHTLSNNIGYTHKITCRNEFQDIESEIYFIASNANYPNWKGVWPNYDNENSIGFTVETKSLIDALKETEPARDEHNKVYLKKDSSVSIASQNKDICYYSEIAYGYTCAQDEVQVIALNAKYLTECIDSKLEFTVFDVSKHINKAIIINNDTLLMPMMYEDNDNAFDKIERKVFNNTLGLVKV